MSSTSPPNPNLQLRIDFEGTPTRASEMILELSGVRVHVDVSAGSSSDAWSYLTAAGVSARVEEGSPILFDVSELSKLTALPDQVRVVPVSHLRTLWDLVSHPPDGGLPATVHVSAGELQLRWFDGDQEWSRPLAVPAVPAFLILGLPFVAERSAWDLLLSSSDLPPRIATARINLNGFCEITATAPQLVESAPLPGLFRIDKTRFGVPARYAHEVSELRGFVWEGRLPAPATRPRLPEAWVNLRPHLRKEIPEIAAALSADSGHVIAWESGLGRRLAALGAVEALDAYPALVVCPPWRVWLWQRQIEETGHSVSMVGNNNADVTITTYHDLSIRTDLISPVAIIFDSPHTTEARTSLPALRALTATYPDAYRIAVVSDLPSAPTELCQLLELVRPGEFAFVGLLALRYPGDSHLQLKTHASCYYSTLSAADAASISATNGPGSLATVEVCEPSEALAAELERIRSEPGRPLREKLASSLEVVSLGFGPHTSPKLARALAFLRSAVVRKRKAVVLVAHLRVASMLRIGIQPARLEVAEGPGANSALARALSPQGSGLLVVHHPSASVDLSEFDEVLLYDYPWDMSVIDRMVGSAAVDNDSDSPQRLVVLHLADSPDDRLALFAALRRARSLTDPTTSQPPTDPDDLAYLLVPRYRDSALDMRG